MFDLPAGLLLAAGSGEPAQAIAWTFAQYIQHERMTMQSIYSRLYSISASLLHAASGGASASDNGPIYIGETACSFPGTLSSGLASLSARPEDSGQGWSA